MTETAVDPALQDEPPVAVPLEMFTDEEMAVLAGPDTIVVSPFLEHVPEQDRPVALRTAYRALVARGIVDPPERPPSVAAAGTTVEVELPMRQDVHAMMTLRRAARGVVAIARTTSTTEDFWYGHVVDDVCLLEQVGSDGIHRFALVSTSELADVVVGAALHPNAADGRGEPTTFIPAGDEAAPRELVKLMGTAVIRADVVLRVVGDEKALMVGIFSGPGGTWCCRTRFGSQSPVEVNPVSADAAKANLADEVPALLGRLSSEEKGRT